MALKYKSLTSQELCIPTPFRLTISGPSGSGKTQWIKRFIQYNEQIIASKFEKIMFAYGEYQELFDEIRSENQSIVWCEGFCHDSIKKELEVQGGKKLLIIDDLLQEVCNDSFFHTFYVRRSHHWNVSIIFTTQYLHQKGLRLVNLNTTHYVLFKSLRDQTPVRTLALQMFPNKWRNFMDIYTTATK